MDSFKLNIGIKMPDIYYLKIIRRNRVMKMFKKGISVLTALVLVFAMFAGTAYAADYRFATELVNENFKDFVFTDNKSTKDGVYYANSYTDRGSIIKSEGDFKDTSNNCLKYTATKTWNDYYVSISRQGSGTKPEWKSGNGSQVLSFRFAYVQSGNAELARINLNGNMYYAKDGVDQEKSATYKWNDDTQSRFLSFKKILIEAFGETFTSSNTTGWFNIDPQIWYTVTLILNGDNTYTLKIYNNSTNSEMIPAKNRTMKYMSVKDYNVSPSQLYKNVEFRGISRLDIAHQGSAAGDTLYIDDVQLYKSEAKNYVINNVKAAGTVVTTFAGAKGKTITAVNIDKYNYSADNTVIAALYDSEGNMKDVCTAKNTLDQFSNGDVLLDGGLEIPADADGYVKVMIFDNMTSLTPLCTAYKLE